METEYKVRLEIFEGPLDLLLYLIKRDEIDIYDISLERITQQYLSISSLQGAEHRSRGRVRGHGGEPDLP
jgi:hypothetical protein